MTRRLIALALALLLAAPLGGCVDVDLGDLPVYCNPGEPRCPRGYRCVRQQGRDYCVREGLDPDEALGALDGGIEED